MKRNLGQWNRSHKGQRISLCDSGHIRPENVGTNLNAEAVIRREAL
jgi:hypothetical protein